MIKKVLLPFLVFYLFFLALVGCKKDKEQIQEEEPNNITLLNDIESRLIINEDTLILLDTVDIGYLKKPSDYKLKYRGTIIPPKVDGQRLRASHINISGNGNFAYVAYNLEGEPYLGAIDVINISNIKKPKIVYTLKHDNMDVNSLYYDNASGNLYMVGATSDETLSTPAVLDVLPYKNHKLDKDVSPIRIDLLSYAGTDVKVEGGKIYVTSGTSGGLSVYDKKDYSLLNSESLDDARSIDYNGSSVAVMQGTTGRIKIYSKTSNQLLSSFAIGGATIPESKSHIWLEDDYIYMAAGDGGVNIVDINTGEVKKNIPIPDLNDIDPSDAVANSVALHDGYIIIGNGGAGVYVIKNSNTYNSMKVMGKIKLKETESINYIAAKDDILLLARGSGGLQIFEAD